jgi:cytochrome c553
MIVKITWRRVLTTVGTVILLGFALAWSGIINIGASTGHWAVTDWFLHWAMRNTVRTQSALGGLSVKKPATDPEGLVSAAGHYAATCAICHGAPGELPSPVMQAATPAAPDLRQTAPEWSDEQLFWIIKHGVKFTAMPAWPFLDRNDEIRRMAAFVRRLPEMSPAAYRSLAYGPSQRILGGEATTLETALSDCTRCHGSDGHGRDQPDIPVLAGQSATYLEATLDAYASGRRASGVMGAVAARLDPAVMRALADHYAALPGLANDMAPVRPADDTPDAALAARIVARGLPEADLPACASCHAPGKHPRYPVLAGQKPEYLATWLRLWRGDESVIDARKPNAPMPVIARRIPERLIEALARHYARP